MKVKTIHALLLVLILGCIKIKWLCRVSGTILKRREVPDTGQKKV